MAIKMWWTAEWRDAKTYQLIAPETAVFVDQRPSLTIEETAIEFLNSTCWIPGKSSWSESKITYIDADNTEGGALFFHWLAKQYQKSSSLAEKVEFEMSCVILRLYDGKGKLTESWYLENAFVTSMAFGDFSATHLSTLEVVVKYHEADYVAGDPATWLKPLEQPQEQQ